MNETFPKETVDLPSRGLLYPSTNPLSSGKVEMKYMSAASEDILTNQSYIQKGTVLDKLLESLIVDKDIKIKDLINLLEHDGYFGSFRVTNKSIYYVHKGTVNV